VARTRRTTEDARDKKYERLTEWAGLRAGDPVDVDGVAGRGLSFSFLAHVRNRETDESWVEVVGGRNGKRDVRSFRPEQIFQKGALKKTKSQPSLADQPGLPLL
jgi:hypothetical protein